MDIIYIIFRVGMKVMCRGREFALDQAQGYLSGYGIAPSEVFPIFFRDFNFTVTPGVKNEMNRDELRTSASVFNYLYTSE